MHELEFWQELPSEVTLYDWDGMEIRLVEVRPAPERMRQGRDWHLGRVADCDRRADKIEPGMVMAFLPWWGYIPSQESEGNAACGYRTVKVRQDGEIEFEPGGSKGSIAFARTDLV